MGYDRGDSFPFDFEPNGDPFGSKFKRKLSPRSDIHIDIPFNVKGNGNIIFSVYTPSPCVMYLLFTPSPSPYRETKKV